MMVVAKAHSGQICAISPRSRDARSLGPRNASRTDRMAV
jgi:hypothetical protein